MAPSTAPAASGPRLPRPWVRHVASALLAAGLIGLFHLRDQHGFGSASWNRSLAWAGIILLSVTLCMGPVARWWPQARWVLPARREIGLWAGVASLGHVVMVFEEWAGWRLSPLWRRFLGDRFVVDGGLLLANALGALAAGYALVLVLTSNDLAQRTLGPRWGWLQRGATTLFLLVVAHTAFFLWLDSARFQPETFANRGLFSGFGGLFLLLVGAVLLVRTLAFWTPARSNKP